MDDLSVIAFKYGESSFQSKYIFDQDVSNRVLQCSWLFFLVRYKEHNILIDTGIGERESFGQYGFQMDHFREPVSLLQDYGLTPSDITDIIVTHAHFDHIGDIGLYPRAQIYIQEDEWEGYKARIDFSGKLITFQTSMLLFDLLCIERIGGHTVGSSIVTFRLGAHTYVFGGDECYINENLEKRIPTGNSINIDKSRGFVDKYVDPNYVVYLCHEPSIIEEATGYKVLL